MRTPIMLTVGVLTAGALGFGGGYLANDDKRPAAAATADGEGKAVTQPLRDEHEALRPKVERLREAGDAVGVAPVAELRTKIAAAHQFLTGELVPHAEAENEVLYAEIDRLLGGQPVTATMSRDHVEVAKLTEELGELGHKLAEAPSAETELELRATLYGLYRLVELHFAKEEEVYLPILERHLTVEQGRELFEKMAHAAEKHGAEHGEHGHG